MRIRGGFASRAGFAPRLRPASPPPARPGAPGWGRSPGRAWAHPWRHGGGWPRVFPRGGWWGPDLWPPAWWGPAWWDGPTDSGWSEWPPGATDIPVWDDGIREGEDFEEDADLSVIGPIDDRVQEIETTRFPWNTMVHLCRDFGDGNCAGCSGALIAPRRVLTAAHCIWSLKRHAAPARILVVPGRSDRRTMPYGGIEARRYWVPRGFIEGPDRSAWDWAVIDLPRPFAGITRFLPVRPLSDSALRRLAMQGRITVAGYPSDRPVGTLWRHAERLVRFSPQRLFHTVDTCPGHSGSPVMARLGDTAAIIGVHTAGQLDAEGLSYGCKRGTVLAPPGAVNGGVRATPVMLEALASPAAPRSGAAGLVRLP